MRNLKNTKIRKHKVPNVLSLFQNNNKAKVMWPNFFSKIQNSFKLLEQPVSLQINESIDEEEKPNKTILSERLTKLARHKQRSTSLNNQSRRFQSLNSQEDKKEQGRNKFVSLPRMQPNFHSNRETKFQVRSIIKQRKIQNYDMHEIQQIAGSKVVSKGFDEIVSQIQYENELKLKKQREKTSQSSQPDEEDEQVVPQPNPSTNPANLLGLEDCQTQNSSKLGQIKGAPNPYEPYDRILMEKIKIYRPKKSYFHHQLAWQ